MLRKTWARKKKSDPQRGRKTPLLRRHWAGGWSLAPRLGARLKRLRGQESVLKEGSYGAIAKLGDEGLEL